MLPDWSVDRRWLLLLLVLLLVLLGIGLGGLPSETRGPTSPALVVSTPTPTPTPTPGGMGGQNGPGTATPTPTPGGGDQTTTVAMPTPDEGTETPSSSTRTPDDDTGDETRRQGGGGGGGGTTGDGNSGQSTDVRLQVAGTSTRLTYADAVPGTSDREPLRLSNTGNGTGQLLLTNLSVSDAENGVGEAEGPADETPAQGDLSEHVMAVIEVHGPDGSVEYLYGTESGPRSLASLKTVGGTDPAGVLAPGEEATIVVDWYIPATTGNEIQGDSVTFDLTFGLRSTAD